MATIKVLGKVKERNDCKEGDMESEKLQVNLKEIRIMNFGDGFDAEGLLTRRRKKRLYRGIDWEKLGVLDNSHKRIKLCLFEISRDAFPEEIIETVMRKYLAMRQPPQEIPLCLLKMFSRKRWDPPWVFLHRPIIQSQREFPHYLVLSGSRLGAARVGNGKPFHKNCLFVFIEP